jgi:hypothetical protein
MSQLSQWLNPRSSAAKMAVLFIVVSVVYYAGGHYTMPWLAFVPSTVVHGLALAFFVPVLGQIPFTGADAIVDSLWVAYGLSLGSSRSNFWGLPVTGNTLALIGASFVLLGGLLGSWLMIVPSLFALALTFVHVRYGFPGDLWVRFTSWRLSRDLAKRSSHLRVIGGDDRNTPRSSDKYLH